MSITNPERKKQDGKGSKDESSTGKDGSKGRGSKGKGSGSGRSEGSSSARSSFRPCHEQGNGIEEAG
ncbi:TPA: hypothetical protein RMT47_005005 [Escherichia coli]|uniref:hypothetical protein n=1 Tax=Vibrio cidicii TaxID=1763883 RepID=UPI0028758561|nr:hypothetical protein [Escherichia coli]